MNTPELPEAFVKSMAAQLGDELPAFLACYDEPPQRGVRVNALKDLFFTEENPSVPAVSAARENPSVSVVSAAEENPSVPAGTSPLSGETGAVRGGGRASPIRRDEMAVLERFSADFLARIPWAADGYYLAAESRIGAHPLHEAGACYIQEPSAMLPAAVLAPRPGEIVLDLCAAPGGKSTQMGALMRGEGLLVCSEPVPDRARVLSRNVERMGLTNTLVISAWPEELAARWPGGFDAVLADAPCSGEGMFRRVPESRLEWQPTSPAGCAARQAEILDAAARLVRPGGRLVYATCTLNRTENEDTVRAFLLRHPDFTLVPFSLPGAQAPEGMLTCWPHRMRGEGQFAALLRRAGDAPAALPVTPLPRPDGTVLSALAEAVGALPADVRRFGETLVTAPPLPDLTGLRVLRCGLHLGAMKGKVFQPDHAWCVSCAPPALPRIPLTEAEARRFQAGEALPAAFDGKGWVLPALSGLPLGLGKVSGGLMKNHYPKGLRRAGSAPER